MRIVQYLKWLNMRDGGTVRAVLDLSAALASHGHEVTVLSCDDTSVPDAWKKPMRGPSGAAVRVPGVPRSVCLGLRDPWTKLLTGKTPLQHRRDTPTQVFDEAGRIEATAIVRGADVVHLHGPWTRTNMQLAAMARSMRVPYVVSAHGMLDDWSMAHGRLKKRAMLAWGARAMLEEATAVHCTAEAELAQARRWFPRGRGVVAPLIFDVGPFEDLPGPGPAREAFAKELGVGVEPHLPVVLFLSRLHAKKGVDTLIDAAGLLHARGRPVRLVIAGPEDPPGIAETLRARARDRGIEGTTSLVGMVSGVTKVSLYQAADVFVLPTSQENWGYVLLEAMAAGTPTITTRGVDIWSELERGGATVVPTISAGAIAAEIGRLLDRWSAEPSARDEASHHARSWVMHAFETRAVVSQYEAIYNAART